MNKMYEPSRQGQEWDIENLMANASTIFGLNGANPDHSVTPNDPNGAIPVSPVGQCSVEGQGRYPNASPPSNHGPNRVLRPRKQFPSGHRGINRRSTQSPVLSSIDDDTRRIVPDRIDGLSPRVGHDDGRLTPFIGCLKRSAPEGPLSPKSNKKRRIEPPPKVPPDHEPSTSFPPARLPEEYEPSRGGKEPKAKPLSRIREEDYYYRPNTSRDDQTYFDRVIKNLREAPYLGNPQTFEPTISSEEGAALVGDVRAEGPGRASGEESVYATLVDKPPSGPFRCWICGHLDKQRKALRALGHVREHFEHRPWQCTQDHRTTKDGKSNPKKRRAKGQDGPW